ncbi:MAG: phage antirepressor protein, partial [Bacilli bacterium]|nr:phage antirepressor protein [Bacilli bacterium]
IAKRLKGIQDRKQLTDVWQEGGITDGKEYAILTNEIYKEWSGMTAKEYKEYKGLRKESLRDNMDNLELILTDLSEETAKRLAEKHKPQGLDQNKEVARMGGHAAKVAREDIEKNLGESVVTKQNHLNYEYKDELEIETK